MAKATYPTDIPRTREKSGTQSSFFLVLGLRFLFRYPNFPSNNWQIRAKPTKKYPYGTCPSLSADPARRQKVILSSQQQQQQQQRRPFLSLSAPWAASFRIRSRAAPPPRPSWCPRGPKKIRRTRTGKLWPYGKRFVRFSTDLGKTQLWAQEVDTSGKNWAAKTTQSKTFLY